jgi:hypothetical protein
MRHLSILLEKYVNEDRPLKACEPRDLLNRLVDICQFKGCALRVTRELIDLAWESYFGKSLSVEHRLKSMAIPARSVKGFTDRKDEHLTDFSAVACSND